MGGVTRTVGAGSAVIFAVLAYQALYQTPDRYIDRDAPERDTRVRIVMFQAHERAQQVTWTVAGQHFPDGRPEPVDGKRWERTFTVRRGHTVTMTVTPVGPLEADAPDGTEHTCWIESPPRTRLRGSEASGTGKIMCTAVIGA